MFFKVYSEFLTAGPRKGTAASGPDLMFSSTGRGACMQLRQSSSENCSRKVKKGVGAAPGNTKCSFRPRASFTGYVSGAIALSLILLSEARSETPVLESQGAEAAEVSTPEASETEVDVPESAAGEEVVSEPEVAADQEVAQPPAMHQALGTGEALLGDLGGLSGEAVGSPFSTQAVPLALPFRLGIVRFKPRLSAGVSAGSFERNGNRRDWISGSGLGLFQGSLQATFGEGLSSAALLYNFGLSFRGQERSSGSGSTGGLRFDQQLSFGAHLLFPEMKRVRFTIGLALADFSGLNRDVGNQTDRVLATLSLGASYAYSRKTSLGWHLSFPIREFSSGLSSRGLTNTLSINRQITRKTSLGIGYSTGFLGVQRGEDQVFQQVLFNVRSVPTIFLSFHGSVGVEYRQAGDSTFNPIFGLGATWNSRRGTTVSLAAESRIFNSATAANTNFTSTSIGLRASQILGYGIVGSLYLGYEYSAYERVGKGGVSGRNDQLCTVSIGLSRPITKRWSSSLSVQFGKNWSNVQPFNYSQITFRTSYAF